MNALDQFIENWKQSALDYYRGLRSELETLRTGTYLVTAENLQAIKSYSFKANAQVNKYSDAKIEEILQKIDTAKPEERHFIVRKYADEIRAAYYRDRVNKLTKNDQAVVALARIDENLIELIEKDAAARKANFIRVVEAKAGKIVDATALRMAPNGMIDGVVFGETCKVKVETIPVGGYNIVCFHYRITVKVIK